MSDPVLASVSPALVEGVVVAAAVLLLLLVWLRAFMARRALRQRLAEVATRLGDDPFSIERSPTEEALNRLERAASEAAGAVTEASSDAIRLRRALDSLPQGVVVCDDRGKVVFRNTHAATLTSGHHGDVLAAEVVRQLLARSWEESAPAEQTLELYGPPRRTLSVRAQIIDDGQRPLGAAAVIDDVSDRRRLEAVRRDFVANVSHELKTPAAALGLLAETLLSEPDPEVTSRLAERIQTEAFRVSRIIDDLLDLSRIEAEESRSREMVLVNLVLAEALEQVRSAAEQRGVDLELREPSPPVAVMGDRRQLVSAFHNLLENAVKYSDPGSVVEVRGHAGPTSVDLEVRDHGIGIPPRDLGRIFERFYRVDQARARNTGGTGLGLSIVRHVANNHGGTVSVSSREGEGSTFTLRLPLESGAASGEHPAVITGEHRWLRTGEHIAVARDGDAGRTGAAWAGRGEAPSDPGGSPGSGAAPPVSNEGTAPGEAPSDPREGVG